MSPTGSTDEGTSSAGSSEKRSTVYTHAYRPGDIQFRMSFHTSASPLFLSHASSCSTRDRTFSAHCFLRTCVSTFRARSQQQLFCKNAGNISLVLSTESCRSGKKDQHILHMPPLRAVVNLANQDIRSSQRSSERRKSSSSMHVYAQERLLQTLLSSCWDDKERA